MPCGELMYGETNCCRPVRHKIEGYFHLIIIKSWEGDGPNGIAV